jgi:pimeloyl-ACP methyl ester carboxylesterase
MTPEEYRQRIDEIQQALADKIASRAAPQKPLNLLLLVHGGLTTQEDGLAYIDNMVDEAGFLKNMPDGYEIYPVFINWDSSLMGSMYDDLFLVRKGIRDPLTGVITSPFVILSRLVGGVVGLPETLVYHYDTEKMQFEKWEGEHRSGYDVLQRAGVTVISLPITLVELPFLSGFGTGAWDMMSRRIAQMFAHQIDPQGTFYRDPDNRAGALREFFETLETNYGANPKQSEGTAPVNVILAGHSMGTMVVNRILRDFPTLNYRRIVYLGAAASIDDFMTTVPPYLARSPGTEFIGYSLSVKDEAGEFNWFAPRGSLLVWIDNIFERGVSPTGKRVGFFLNKNAFRFRQRDGNGDVCERLHFRKFVADEGENVPHKHGEFNDNGKIQEMLAIAMGKTAQPGVFVDINNVCCK